MSRCLCEDECYPAVTDCCESQPGCQVTTEYDRDSKVLATICDNGYGCRKDGA